MQDADDEVKDVSKAESVAGVIAKTATTSTVGAVKTITYRVGLADLAAIDAMAAESGKSRNAMVNLLVSVGLEEVRKLLPAKVAKGLVKRESTAIKALMADGSVDQIQE